MSGSIGRSYLIQSWNNASEYSGEMIGNRQKASTELYLKNGKANTALFADHGVKKATKKTISIRDRICPQQKTYERLEQMQKDLEQEFLAGKIADEEYLSLSAVLDKKMQRAWALLAKAMNWKDDTEQELYCDDSCDFTLDGLHSQDKVQEYADNLFLNLTDGNVFKTSYIFIVRLMQIFKR